MGLTNLKLTVKNPLKHSRRQDVEFFVDSGAVYSVIDKKILNKLGITPTGKKTFFLANNTSVDRKVGDAYFEYGGESGYSKVVFW